MKLSHRVFFLAFTIATFTNLLLSQWSTDYRINTPVAVAPGTQATVRIISDGAGGTIIMWQDNRNIAGDIYAQRLNSLGVPQWTANGVAVCAAAGIQTFPDIAPDGAGGAIIAWQDGRGLDYDIYAQRINASGTPLWTANGIPIDTIGGMQRQPRIISDGSGGAIIAWMDARSGSTDIYAQRVNSGGVTQWTANGVAICTDASDQSDLSLGTDGSGGAIIAWQDTRGGTGSGDDIYAQRISSSGTVQWTANGVGVCTATGNQWIPVLVSDASGAIIAWTDYRNGNGDVVVQRLNSSGVAQWTANGVDITGLGGQEILPMIAPDGTGGAVVAWEDSRSGNINMFAQRITNTGILLWKSGGVALAPFNAQQYNEALVPDGTGGAIVAWEDYRGAGVDIWAQRIGGSGVVQWAAEGVIVSSQWNEQQYAVLVGDGAGNAVITWSDNRSASWDIYAQRIDRIGCLGKNEPVLNGVRDVPGDQGGNVTVAWSRSLYDQFPNQLVTYYSVWRGIDPPGLSPAFQRIEGGAMPENAGGRVYREVATAAGSTYWEWVGNLTSHYLSNYSFTAPTLADSTAGGTRLFKFFVSAQTANQFVFWDSNIDSGYSVDNLPPVAPTSLAGVSQTGKVALHWNRNVEGDLAGYLVFRSMIPNFDPKTIAAYATTKDTMFIDISPLAGNSYYALQAEDIHGNLSPKSNELSITVTSVGGVTAPPTEFALLQNYPNPFNPSTTIRYQLPMASHVTLKVFDVLAHEVATLIDRDQDAGFKSVKFDCSGMAAGVYLYRLQAGSFVETRKLLLLK